VRQASRVLARTSWLGDPLIHWTGRREAIPQLEGALTPIRALIQDRLIGLLAGFYAVRIDAPASPSKSRLLLEVSAVDAVTRELVAQTARAIEAVSKFPKAATKLVGPVGPWCDQARRTLGERRQTTESGRARRIGAAAQARSPASLNDRLAECYTDESRLVPSAASIPADERAALAPLALLLEAIDAVRREPARRLLMLDPAIGFIHPDLATTPRFDKANPGHAADPAGAFAVVAAAGRLRHLAGAHACTALAAWLEACRPILPTVHFWPSALSILASDREPASPERARAMVTSLSTHAARLALLLGTAAEDEAQAVRQLLPAVLARGPEATDRALRRGLWLDRVDGLDAALSFVEVAERASAGADPAAAIPMPRRVFESADALLRDALLEFGLALHAGGDAEATAVTFLLHLILDAAGRPGSAPWSATLPGLHDEGRMLWRRIGTRGLGAHGDLAGDAPVLAFIALDACARWAGSGFGDLRRLARLLANRWPSSDQASAEWDPDHDDHNNLLVLLSEGRVSRFLTLMRLARAPRRHAWQSLDGHRLMAAHATARAWMSAALESADLQPRVIRLLGHAGLLKRLDPGLRPARLFAPCDAPAGRAVRWPVWVSRDQAGTLSEIAQAHAVSVETSELPGTLQRILDRPKTMAREGAALRARAARRPLSGAEHARLGRLDTLAGDPAARRADLRRALDQALPKQRTLAGLSALETVVRGALDRRWQSALGGEGAAPRGPAWDNALLMLESVTHNRRVLRRVLRESARGNGTWMFDLEPNRAFLSRLAAAGVSAEAWLAAHARTIQIGGAVLTAYTATDPIEVLQMGSLFGTCLSANRFNAHAAVAAAVEANKRVLYVRDGAGRILGRQLLAITAAGEIIGFTCYGAGVDDSRSTGQRARLTLALLALDIVRASGARLMPGVRAAEGLTGEQERALALFCKGYVDTPLAFDWWIEDLAAATPSPEADDRARVAGWLLDPVPPHRDARPAPDWRREELGRETARALLWLGADAPDLPESQKQALGLQG